MCIRARRSGLSDAAEIMEEDLSRTRWSFEIMGRFQDDIGNKVTVDLTILPERALVPGLCK